MKSKILLIWSFSMFFLACNDANFLYQKNHNIEAEWSKESKIGFDLKGVFKDSVQQVNTFLNLRHNNAYPYKNIWLFVETKFPNGLVKTDTLEYYLSDDTGKWKGLGMGEVKENLFVLNHSQKIEFQDSMRIEIKHGMRDSLLVGVEDITLVIEKVK